MRNKGIVVKRYARIIKDHNGLFIECPVCSEIIGSGRLPERYTVSQCGHCGAMVEEPALIDRRIPPPLCVDEMV